MHYSCQADISRDDFCLKKTKKPLNTAFDMTVHQMLFKETLLSDRRPWWFCRIGVDQMGGFRCGLSKSESKALWSCTAAPDLQRSRSSTRGRVEHYHFPDGARWRLSDNNKKIKTKRALDVGFREFGCWKHVLGVFSGTQRSRVSQGGYKVGSSPSPPPSNYKALGRLPETKKVTIEISV